MAAFSPVRGFCSSVRFVRCFHASSSSRSCLNLDVRWLRTAIKHPVRRKVSSGACCARHRNIHDVHQQLRMASQYLQPSNVQTSGIRTEPLPDPFLTAKDEVKEVFTDIVKQLQTDELDLCDVTKYYFDGQGKALRPTITILMAKAINSHIHGHESIILATQRHIAMIAEMIHTASLLHDDVIDMSATRRGKPSASIAWGQKKSVLAGDFILSISSGLLARIGNSDVTIAMSQVVADLVQGEFMQLGSKEEENDRFQHYLLKTFKKTASLIAYSCKGVSILAGADIVLQELAFQYGRNLGIAFQLVDDVLDFVSTTSTAGKPTGADLKLGLATAPVLFASEMYPELNPMIMRRFSEPGDADKAYEAVLKSDGIEQTRFLAHKHLVESVRLMQQLADSPDRRALVAITDLVLNRSK